MRKFVAVVSERDRDGEALRGPRPWAPPVRAAVCGVWRRRPERERETARKMGGLQEKGDREKGKVIACVKED